MFCENCYHSCTDRRVHAVWTRPFALRSTGKGGIFFKWHLTIVNHRASEINDKLKLIFCSGNGTSRFDTTVLLFGGWIVNCWLEQNKLSRLDWWLLLAFDVCFCSNKHHHKYPTYRHVLCENTVETRLIIDVIVASACWMAKQKFAIITIYIP
jgi:hypothetical protein